MTSDILNDVNTADSENKKPVVVWSDQLLTGLDDIDDQHRKLLDMINELGRLQACDTSLVELINVYGKLKDYTRYHFQHEEDLMNAWPVNETNKVEHFKAHHDFIERIGQIDRLIESHPSYVVDHLLAFQLKWLIHHISDMDALMAVEVLALQAGKALQSIARKPRAMANKDQVNNSINDLYDGIETRSLEVLDLNVLLQAEIARRKQAVEDAQLAVLVFDNSSKAMTVTNADNEIIAVNPAFTQLTGYLPEEVMGMNPGILSSGRHDQAFYQQMWESLDATGHWDGELWNRHKNGEIFAEGLSINTIYKKDGSVDRRVSVFSDITQKKLDEEKIAQQAVELKQLADMTIELNIKLSQEIAVKNRLFSIIAHDLRSPFTILLGLSDRMFKKADTLSKEKLSAQASSINRVAKNVFTALENLLEWSHSQLDGEKIDIQKVPLGEIVDATLDLLHPVADAKGIAITNNIQNDYILADYHYLLTVLRNLVSNAIKFTNQGGTIDISSQTTGTMVDIAVSDTGTGISENIIDKLFAIDQKTTTLGTGNEKGSGLGLPLCAELVKKMGGVIKVESTHGTGSRFVFSLPVAPQP
ncbi:MAG: PAS domain S-box protein [Rhodospirillales bacterium]|nr:PAS domain S-box protein [Rhodospirillales bacterium]